MTSEGGCYVYMTLPRQVKPVTAGRYVLNVDRRGEPIGRFVYGRSYLARDDKVEIDPIELKLGDRTYETVRAARMNLLRPRPVGEAKKKQRDRASYLR